MPLPNDVSKPHKTSRARSLSQPGQWVEDRIHFDRHEIDRGLGALSHVLRMGPAIRRPSLHRWLLRAGVLSRSPESWEDSLLLSPLPWGARPVDAPPAAPPPGVGGLWPQPPVVDPGFYPPVLHLQGDDRREHFRYNAARYAGQIVRLALPAALRSLRGPRLAPLDDATFVDLLTQTSLGQFVTFDLEDHDLESFAPVLGSGGAADHAKLDFSAAPVEHALPGISVAKVVVLLRRDRGAGYQAAAIRTGERLWRPEDGAGWQLAQYFAMQGAQTRLVLSAHPRLHFPNDAIIAVTRALVPPGHLLRQLIEPHTRFTLGLNEAVIHHRRSVLHNSQQELYTPFPYRTEGTHALFVTGRKGVAGNRAYPPYRFDTGLFGEHVPYGRFRRDWFALYHDFAARIAALIPKGDAIVQRWAEHVHAWVPGFPAGGDIFVDDTLPRALGSYICSVSAFHTGDHHSYAAIALERLPWRLRAAASDLQPSGALDRDALVSVEDFFRHQLCHEMFFVPVIIQSLRKVRYGFQDSRAREAVRRLRSGMDEIDARWEGSGFPASGRIASSLQY